MLCAFLRKTDIPRGSNNTHHSMAAHSAKSRFVLELIGFLLFAYQTTN
jgi:hypothetical protein